MEQVFIFKTDVDTPDAVQKVAAMFTSLTGIRQWNIDLDDCDRILRVVASGLHPAQIEQLLQSENVYCENWEYEL